jgi:hypothetical protein
VINIMSWMFKSQSSAPKSGTTAASPARPQHQDKSVSGSRPIPGNRAVQFIRIAHNSFQVTDEAMKILSRMPKGVPICVLSVAGVMRSGKSFLLNTLLNRLDGTGFAVSPMVDPCTLGLWMWDTPIEFRHFGLDGPGYVIIVDTEGLYSFTASATRDAYIMALAVLLSSVFVYNTVGTITEQAIQQWVITTTLVQQVVSESQRANAQLPTFWWVLRDYALEDDRNADATLEMALENKGNEHDETRRVIRQVFPERHLVRLVRPVYDERQLRNMTHETALRPEFMQGLSTWRNELVRNLKTKQIGGVQIDGPMLADLAQHFCRTVNSGAVPQVKDTFHLVTMDICQRAVDEISKLVDEQGFRAFGSVDSAIAAFIELAGSAASSPSIAEPFVEKVRIIMNRAQEHESALLIEQIHALPTDSPQGWLSAVDNLLQNSGIHGREDKVIRAMLASCSRIMSALQSQVEQVRRSEETKARELDVLRAEVQRCTQEIHSLRAENANKQTALGRLQDQFSAQDLEKSKQIQDQNAEIHRLRAEASNRDSAQSQHKREKDSLTADIHRLQNETLNKDQEIDRLRRAQSAKDHELEDKAEEARRLQATVASRGNHERELNAQVHNLTRDKESLQEQLQMAQAELAVAFDAEREPSRKRRRLTEPTSDSDGNGYAAVDQVMAPAAASAAGSDAVVSHVPARPASVPLPSESVMMSVVQSKAHSDPEAKKALTEFRKKGISKDQKLRWFSVLADLWWKYYGFEKENARNKP